MTLLVTSAMMNLKLKDLYDDESAGDRHAMTNLLVTDLR